MVTGFIATGVLFLSLWTKEALTRSELTCAGGKVYLSCGSACISALTCDTYEDRQDIVCATVCVEGCFCPEGTVDHNGTCISPLECPMYQSVCNGVQCPSYTMCQSNAITGDSGCYPNCGLLNGGCHEDQICEVMSFDNSNNDDDDDNEGFTADPHNYYINCMNAPYVSCDDSLKQCIGDSYHCLRQNKTGQSACIASCLSSNGGCREDQVCVTKIQRGDDSMSDSMSISLRCLDSGDLSSECPAGQMMNECGDHCQETCEHFVTGQSFACIAVCGPPACICPFGLMLFRDRCVDSRLCYHLVENPPAINPLPLVEDDRYLYSLFTSGATREDFLEGEFLDAVQQVLSSEGFPDVNVDLHGLHENHGLQIVVVLSGDGVSAETASHLAEILMTNSNQLPLHIDRVSIMDVERVDVADRYWTSARIGVVAFGAVAAVAAMVVLVTVVVVVVAKKRSHMAHMGAQSRSSKVEVHHLEDEGRQTLVFET